MCTSEQISDALLSENKNNVQQFGQVEANIIKELVTSLSQDIVQKDHHTPTPTTTEIVVVKDNDNNKDKDKDVQMVDLTTTLPSKGKANKENSSDAIISNTRLEDQ